MSTITIYQMAWTPYRRHPSRVNLQIEPMAGQENEYVDLKASGPGGGPLLGLTLTPGEALDLAAELMGQAMAVAQAAVTAAEPADAAVAT